MKNALKYAGLATGLLTAALLATLLGTSAADETRGLEKASIFLEFNLTDNDAGVHIDTDHNAGLRELRVVAPNGRIVVDGKWNDALGLTEMKTESSEPSPERTLQAWPAGVYRFSAQTLDGKQLASVATLSHTRLPTPRFTVPVDGATGVPTSGVTAVWTTVPGAVGYFLEIDGPDGQKLETFLPPTRNSFPIPAVSLTRDAEYKLGIASIHANGNLSLSSIEFETGR